MYFWGVLRTTTCHKHRSHLSHLPHLTMNVRKILWTAIPHKRLSLPHQSTPNTHRPLKKIVPVIYIDDYYYQQTFLTSGLLKGTSPLLTEDTLVKYHIGGSYQQGSNFRPPCLFLLVFIAYGSHNFNRFIVTMTITYFDEFWMKNINDYSRK